MKSALSDPFGRKIEYLRISVTDRCDLRCSYCIPRGYRGFKTPQHWLTFEEIERLVKVFAQSGLKRIRLTGGEPLVRKNLPDLVHKISEIPGIEDLSLSTNATHLEKHATVLKAAGIQRLNVSLDTLDRRVFEKITGRDVLGQVLAGLNLARDLGFNSIKINMLVMAGINEQEVESMLDYCLVQGFTLRLIETMPMGAAGRGAGHVNLQPIKQRLRDKFNLVDSVMPGGGPARYMATPDGKMTVGFITPLSQHFCATCNRVRLAVDGTLYLCLGQENSFGFRQLLRADVSDIELRNAVIAAISLKPERHEFDTSRAGVNRLMSLTGG
jgi:GTP 3',8-cyclase